MNEVVVIISFNLPVWLPEFTDDVTVVPEVCKEGVGVSVVIGV